MATETTSTTTVAPLTTIGLFLAHLLLVCVLVAGAVYGVDSIVSAHDARSEAKYSQLLDAQTTKTEADEKTLEATIAAITTQNANLVAENAKTDAALVAQQKIDASLTAQQAATKLGGTVVGTDVDLPLDTARGMIEQIDSIPPLKADLANETQIAANDQKEIDSQTNTIADLKAQFVDEQTSCSAQIKVVKAQARKSKIKWFFAGVVAGFTLGHIY